jgi:hypothetical protein
MWISVGRALAALAIVVLSIASGACGSGLFRQYEYEEEMYLSLDGSATLYVNSSIAALNALRGTAFDPNPSGRFDREPFQRYFSTAHTRVTRVTSSRRNGRRFVHVRVEVDDVRRLGEAAPFSWSTYRFDRVDDRFRYQQTVGPAAGVGDNGSHRERAALNAAWSGGESVAFRLHLPSKIEFHNTGRAIGRGNSLVWEQPLADRLHGAPLDLEARMQTQSILYRTLWLFALTFVTVALAFAAVIWWIVRRGRKPAPPVNRPSPATTPGARL